MPLCYNFNVLSDSQIMLNLLICQFGGSSIFVQWLGWVGAFTNIVLDTPRGIWARTDAKLDFFTVSEIIFYLLIRLPSKHIV